MNKVEYLEQLSECVLDEGKVCEINNKYGVEIPEDVKKIISIANNPVFFDDGYRALAYGEILNANNEFGVDFIGLGIIPFVDCYDNDYIVYHIKDKIWSKFNIFDKCFFKKKETLDELFK